jgi:hypothetical protein
MNMKAVSEVINEQLENSAALAGKIDTPDCDANESLSFA